MCKFLTAIGLKDGDIICDKNIDSHELHIEANSLNDNSTNLRNWVRLEFNPEKAEELADISKYKLTIDDSNFDWITSSLKNQWIEKLKVIVKKTIIDEDKTYLTVGRYILKGKINIKYLINTMIEDAGRATIEDAGGATIRDVGHATIKNNV